MKFAVTLLLAKVRAEEWSTTSTNMHPCDQMKMDTSVEPWMVDECWKKHDTTSTAMHPCDEMKMGGAPWEDVDRCW